MSNFETVFKGKKIILDLVHTLAGSLHLQVGEELLKIELGPPMQVKTTPVPQAPISVKALRSS